MISLILTLLTLCLTLFQPTFSNPIPTSLCEPVKKCLAELQSDRECPNLLPVPVRSFLPPRPLGYLLTQYRPSVWVYDDGSYNSLILYSHPRLVVIDFIATGLSNLPNGTGTRLTAAVDEILAGHVPTSIDMIYSHAHFDHIGAATRFFDYARATFPKAPINVWGTKESARLIKDSTRGLAVLPTVRIGKQGRTIRLRDGLRVEMNIVGGHAQEDLLIYIPESAEGKGVVMLVDIVFPRWPPPFNFAITQDLREYIRAHKKILKKNFGLYVGGHIRTGDRADVKVSLEYVRDVVSAARQADKEVTLEVLFENGFGDTFDPNNVAFGNAWYGFIRVQRRVQIDICYKILLRKWGCRIGAVDITARGHCFTALQYLLIDD